MRLPLLPSLCTWLCMVLGLLLLLLTPVDAMIDHLQVPHRIHAGKPFTVTFHTLKSPTETKQWIALVGVILGEPLDSSLGHIVGSVHLDEAKLSQTGSGSFQMSFVAPNLSAATLGRKGKLVTVTAQYLETHGPTNKGDIRSQSIVATLMP